MAMSKQKRYFYLIEIETPLYNRLEELKTKKFMAGTKIPTALARQLQKKAPQFPTKKFKIKELE